MIQVRQGRQERWTKYQIPSWLVVQILSELEEGTNSERTAVRGEEGQRAVIPRGTGLWWRVEKPQSTSLRPGILLSLWKVSMVLRSPDENSRSSGAPVAGVPTMSVQ